MPFAAALLMLDVMFVWHAARTGRLCPWAFIILAIPGFGALAYIAIEIVPEWLGSIEGQKARATLDTKLDPLRRYRELTRALAVADTVANRAALAEECLSLKGFEEANQHFEAILRQPQGAEPAFAFGKARAEFGLGAFNAAVATLDELRARWPQFQSADAHLLYARALDGAGRTQEAIAEYEALVEYFPGAEARVRYAELLTAIGRGREARAMFLEVKERAARAPAYVRKLQAEWIAAADRALQA
ncbi:MAG: tetratricopeptide repeat protein [Pseudorhodoplanes sp.]|nr:tetratricopeptide repeat protein [Pseudorhodoplanes sp.]